MHFYKPDGYRFVFVGGRLEFFIEDFNFFIKTVIGTNYFIDLI